MNARDEYDPERKRIGVFHADEMTPRQREIYQAIGSGPRGGVPLPFLAMLDAPDIAEKVQALGSAIRFEGKSSVETREVATLATAAALGSGYEWDYHVAIARQCGIAQSVIACAAGQAPGEDVDPSVRAVVRLCRDAVIEKKVSPSVLDDVIKHHGREVATEIVAVAGYYQMLALFLAAAELDTAMANVSRKNALWNFSLKYYSRPAVADACLFLQDNYDVDVNVLLSILWLAAAGKSLSFDEMTEIDGQVKKWRDCVVAPLRAVRRSIPKSAEQESRMEFRASLKMLELHAERIEQDELFALFEAYRAVAPNSDLARQNLDVYARYLNCSFREDVIDTLLAAYEALRTI